MPGGPARSFAGGAGKRREPRGSQHAAVSQDGVDGPVLGANMAARAKPGAAAVFWAVVVVAAALVFGRARLDAAILDRGARLLNYRLGATALPCDGCRPGTYSGCHGFLATLKPALHRFSRLARQRWHGLQAEALTDSRSGGV